MSRLTKLSLISSRNWQHQSCSTSHSQLAQSDKSSVTSKFKLTRGTSSPSAETHNHCVSGAYFIKRFANSLESTVSVGCSASTDSDRCFTVNYVVAIMQQRWTRVRCPSWWTVNQIAQCFETLVVGHNTRRRSVLVSESDCTFENAYCLKIEVSHAIYNRGS